MEPQPPDSFESNANQYNYAAPNYSNYQMSDSHGAYPHQFAKPMENSYHRPPPGFNTQYMGQSNQMMNNMMPVPAPMDQNFDGYSYQYGENEGGHYQTPMMAPPQYAPNISSQHNNDQFIYNTPKVQTTNMFHGHRGFGENAMHSSLSPKRMNAGSPLMRRPLPKPADDFSSRFGFTQDYSMQNLDEENKGGQEITEIFKPSSNPDTEEQSTPKDQEEDSPNVIKLKKTGKPARARRKSSTLDMLETDNFYKQVEEQIEKVKDQNTTESGSEEITSKASKGSSPINSLRNSLRGKKLCAPYRPANYQATHLSPSPKRMNPLNSPSLRSMRSGTFCSNQPPPARAQDFDYEDQDNCGFSLQLNRTEDETPVMGSNFQRSYSHSMKYNDSSRIQGYNHGGVPQQMHPNMHHQNMHGTPFVNHLGYSPYERDTYSPDVNRRAYIDPHQMKRYSHHNPHMLQENWQGYHHSQFQPQAYPNQTQMRQSVPEKSMKMRTDSSRSSFDMNSVSQGEDMEAKSLSNYEEGPNGYDINSPELVEKAYEFAKDQAGCRLLQKKITDGSMKSVEEIYDKILPKFVELMNNPFGNYLCQKITEAVDEDRLRSIIGIIEEDVHQIC